MTCMVGKVPCAPCGSAWQQQSAACIETSTAAAGKGLGVSQLSLRMKLNTACMQCSNAWADGGVGHVYYCVGICHGHRGAMEQRREQQEQRPKKV